MRIGNYDRHIFICRKYNKKLLVDSNNVDFAGICVVALSCT